MTTTIPPRQTTEQRRAAHAWSVIAEIVRKYPHRIENGKQIPDKRAKNYGHQLKDLPTRILAAGLGQTLAFLWAKRDEQTEELLRRLSDWVLDKRPNAGSTKAVPEPQALIRAIIADSADAMLLRRATEESLAYLQWLKRFAEAEGLTKGDDA